jgi:HEPN domain-containing protein
LGASQALATPGYFAHSLFFAHLVLEKLRKALWIKAQQSVEYPYTHNLIRLLKDACIKLTEKQIKFYSDMNLFQAKGRYPDTLHAVETTITKDAYSLVNGQLKTEIQWLIKQLQ